MGVLRDSDNSWYMREEAGGFILGPYEKGAPCCYVNGPSKDSEYELFQEDLDRLAPHIEGAIKRVPLLRKSELKKFITVLFVIHQMETLLLVPPQDLKTFGSMMDTVLELRQQAELVGN